MKPQKILLTLVLIITLAVCAYAIDFRAAQAQTQTEDHVQSFSLGIEQGQPKPAINQLTIYVEEPAYLLGSVRQGLVKAIQDTYAIEDLRVVYDMPGPQDGAVMYVKVTPKQFIWLPLFTWANFDLRLVYASDGKLDWMDDSFVNMTESPSLRMKGQFSLTDSSMGVMTLRGQVRYLGRQIAAEFLEAIQSHLY
jgi:HAMP domain-containing protein